MQAALGQVKVPKIRRTADGGSAFKLSSRVLGASIPGLPPPGIASRQRPFLRVASGSTKKETEFADFDTSFDSAKAGAGATECPWRFSDTLTFELRDAKGPGLQLNLRAKKDIVLGPLQVALNASEIGTGAVNVAERILPACVQERRGTDGQICSWYSPMMLVPLNHVRGGICGGTGGIAAGLRRRTPVLEQTFGHAAAAAQEQVSVTMQTLSEAEKRLGKTMRSTKRSIDDAKKVVEECSTQTLRTLQAAEHKLDGQLNVLAANVDRMIRAGGNTSSTPGPGVGAHDALPPDLDPDAWVCYRGPNGQSCWHHKALGPAPWDEQANDPASASRPPAETLPAAPTDAQASQQAHRSGGIPSRGTRERAGSVLFLDGEPDWKRVSNAWHSSVDWILREGVRQQPGVAVGRNATRARSAGPAASTSRGAATNAPDREFPSWLNGPSWAMPSPEEMPEGWVCHHTADGRTMWHHEALGPAPWDLEQHASVKKAAVNDDMVSTRAPSHGDDEDPCETDGEGTSQPIRMLRTAASSSVPHSRPVEHV